MANGKTESVEDAVTLCLNGIAQGAGKPFAPGVREFMHAQFLPNFTAHHDYWPHYRKVVLRSATFLGRFAALYAEFANSDTITEDHASLAMRNMREVCPAVISRPGDPKLDWCPSRRTAG